MRILDLADGYTSASAPTATALAIYFDVTATESVAAAGSITSVTTSGLQFRRVQGSGAARTASTTPFGTTGGWTTGTIIILMGKSDSNTLTITHNDIAKGALLNGDATLGDGNMLGLMYLSTEDRWQEMFRNF